VNNMKWVIYSLTSFLSIIALASSCQKEEVLPDAMLPSNLNFTASHISGDVTVNASAQSANFYTVIFYDTDDTVFVQTETGVATYTYALSGTYKITVRANLTEMDYIESSKNVTIYVDQNVTGAPTTGYSTPSS